jgi:cellulose synthase/poly-beta-1,6-N-acetylglucosamine synthase-like glycosyltransferase
VLQVAFWLCVACLAYTYAAYPLLLGLLARLRPRPVRRRAPAPRSVSLVLAAHNEAAGVERRLAELTALLTRSDLDGEVIVVVNGSTDDTAARARRFEAGGVRVVELAGAVGKAAALSEGVSLARGEVVAFADVRQTWAPDALALLLENFADPDVGAVSGDLVVESAPGVLAGVALYWRFEKWLRVCESRVWSMVGATGAISAVRRELFRPIPPGTLLDDVYWPLCVAMQGRRVVHDPRAHAFDRLPPRASDELRRKVRTLTGNFQLLTLLPAALLPWRNPVWLQLVSHKLLRLVVPWALLALLPLSLALPAPWSWWALGCQAAGYGLALLGLAPAVGRHFRPAAAAASFLVLNSAAWLAFWAWLSGRGLRTWKKVEYSSERGAEDGAALRAPRSALEEVPS